MSVNIEIGYAKQCTQHSIYSNIQRLENSHIHVLLKSMYLSHIAIIIYHDINDYTVFQL